MKNFWSLIGREFRLFWNNKVLRILFIGAPLLYGILLGGLYHKGKVTGLPVIVVDEDMSGMSRKLVQMIEDNETVNVAALLHDQFAVNEKMIEAEAACVVMIPRDFEKDILTKQHPELTTIVNTSNVLTANYASSALQIVLGTLKAGVQLESLRKQGMPESQLMAQYEPFKTTFVKKNNRSTNYMYFLWPGVLITVLQQVILLGLALSFSSEYEKGTFGALLEQSSNIFTLLMVKIIPYLIMSLGIWLLYGVMVYVLKMPFFEHTALLSFSALVFTLAVCFIGVLVSILLPNQLQATEVLMVVATPAFMLSGFTWPLSQMPAWIQSVAQVIPTTHFLPVFRKLVIEQAPPEYIWPHILRLLVITAVGFTASCVALTIKKRRYFRSAES